MERIKISVAESKRLFVDSSVGPDSHLVAVLTRSRSTTIVTSTQDRRTPTPVAGVFTTSIPCISKPRYATLGIRTVPSLCLPINVVVELVAAGSSSLSTQWRRSSGRRPVRCRHIHFTRCWQRRITRCLSSWIVHKHQVGSMHEWVPQWLAKLKPQGRDQNCARSKDGERERADFFYFSLIHSIIKSQAHDCSLREVNC